MFGSNLTLYYSYKLNKQSYPVNNFIQFSRSQESEITFVTLFSQYYLVIYHLTKNNPKK